MMEGGWMVRIELRGIKLQYFLMLKVRKKKMGGISASMLIKQKPDKGIVNKKKDMIQAGPRN